MFVSFVLFLKLKIKNDSKINHLPDKYQTLSCDKANSIQSNGDFILK